MNRSNQKVNKKFGIYNNFTFSDNDISSVSYFHLSNSNWRFSLV